MTCVRLPSSDLTSASTAGKASGSYWRSLYGGLPYSQAVASVVAGADRDLQQKVQTLAASVQRSCAPPSGRRWRWKPWTIRLNDRLQRGGFSIYGQGETYGGQIFYTSEGGRYVWKAPPDVETVAAISTGIGSGDVIWVEGVDVLWEPRRGTVEFLSANPLADKEEITLFLWQCDSWSDDRRFGGAEILGFPYAPSPNRYRLTEATWSCMTEGYTEQNRAELWSAWTDTPFSLHDNDRVLGVHETKYGWLIDTEYSAYRVVGSASPTVSEGDYLRAGQSLTDAIRVWRPGRSAEVPGWIDSLNLSLRWIGKGSQGWLKLPNEDVNIGTLNSDSLPSELVTSGSNQEAWTSWWAANRNSIKRVLGNTWKLGIDPSSNQLPSAWNPLQFFVAHHLTGSCEVVMVDLEKLGPNAVREVEWGHIRKRVEISAGHTVLVTPSGIELDPNSGWSEGEAGDLALSSQYLFTLSAAELANLTDADIASLDG